MPWLVGIGAFLKRIPSWAYIALAAVALLWFAYHKGASDKDAEWVERIEKAELQAKIEAEKAIKAADKEADTRALAHAAQQSALNKVIQDAEDSGDNSLDALLDSLRP